MLPGVYMAPGLACVIYCVGLFGCAAAASTYVAAARPRTWRQHGHVRGKVLAGYVLPDKADLIASMRPFCSRRSACCAAIRVIAEEQWSQRQ